jgi:hypothetical protein
MYRSVDQLSDELTVCINYLASDWSIRIDIWVATECTIISEILCVLSGCHFRDVFVLNRNLLAQHTAIGIVINKRFG